MCCSNIDVMNGWSNEKVLTQIGGFCANTMRFSSQHKFTAYRVMGLTAVGKYG